MRYYVVLDVDDVVHGCFPSEAAAWRFLDEEMPMILGGVVRAVGR